MKIAIFTTMPHGVYSGGRYLAQILGHALNRAGAEVVYMANNDAMFDADFAPYDMDRPLQKVIGPDYTLPEGFKPDWVVVIPTGGFNQQFYNKALQTAWAYRARVALLSFETPNWFNSLSPFSRSPLPTESWRQVIARGGAVITIAQEGISYARDYFGAARDDLFYAAWHPPINDRVADAATPIPDGRKRVMMFTRTEDPHKGAQDLLAIDPAVLAGHTLSLVFGRGVNTAFAEAVARHFGTGHDIEIELHDRISDAEKFNLIASSDLLLFPSYFEGFGYPPVEAAYMGVPSVAYDLPLLRESVADSAHYVTPGDTAAFSRAIAQVLAEGAPRDAVRAGMAIAPDTLTAGQRFVDILKDATRQVPVQTAPPAPVPVPSEQPSIVDPTAYNISRALEGDLQIHELRAQMHGDRLHLSGQVAGTLIHRRLRFQFDHAELPDVSLGLNGTASDRFEVSGKIHSWSADALVQSGKVLVIERGGLLREKTRFDVQPTAEVLLEHRFIADGSQGARPSHARKALFVLRDSFLFGAPQDALCAAALVQSFDALNVDSTFHVQKTGFGIPPDTEADFMPLVSQVLRLPPEGADAEAPDALGDAVARTLEAEGIALVETAVLDAGALEVPAGAHPTPVGPEGVLTLLTTRRPPAGWAATLEAALTPAALHGARRSMMRQSRRSVLALCPPGPVDILPQNIRDLLAHLRVTLPALEVVLPRRLCRDPFVQNLWFGGTGVATVCDEATLVAHCRQAPRMAVLAWPAQAAPASASGARDILMQGLLDSLPPDRTGAWIDAPATPQDADTGTDSDTDTGTDPLQRLRQVLTPPQDTPLRDALAALFPDAAAAAQQTPRARLHAHQPLPWAEPRVAPPPPVFTRTRSLCFTSPNTDSRSALYAGWGSMSETGTLLKDDSGVICFRVPPAERRAGTRLDVLVRLKDISEATTFTLYLGGQPAGRVETSEPGYFTVQAELGPEHWTDGDDSLQYLGAHCTGAGTCTILAAALSDPRPEEPDWADRVAPTDTQAPLRRALPARFVLQNGQVPKGLLLRTGWNNVEDDGCWGGGDYVALGFEGLLQARSPMILRLRGKPFLPRAGMTQTVGFSVGLSRFAESRLDSADSVVTTIALPQAACDEGIDTLFLDYAHAASPKQLGISSDPRLLGYFLEEVTLAHTDGGSATHIELSAEQRAFDGAPLTLPARAGVLRISGPGDVPAGIGFGFEDAPALALPQAAGPGGWEACLALPKGPRAQGRRRLIALSLTDTGDLAALPDIAQITFWPQAAAEATPCDITLVHTAGRTTAADPQGRLHDPAVGINFALPEQPHTVLGTGWSAPEEDYVWSDGDRVSLNIAANDAHHRFAVLTAGAFMSQGEHGQRFALTLGGGAPLATFTATQGSTQRYLAALPPTDRTPQVPGFDLPDAISPQAAGLHNDRRRLAMRLNAFHTEPTGAPDLRAVPVWTEAGQEHGLNLVANSPTGAILRLSGRGPAPFGVQIAERATTVAHPVQGPAPDMWFADLALDDQTQGREWHVQTVSDGRKPEDGLYLPETLLCTFHIAPKDAPA